MDSDEVRNSRSSIAQIPVEASTLHSFFGPTPQSETRLGGKTQVMYRTRDETNVFTLESVREMCRLERLWARKSILQTSSDEIAFYHSPARISKYLQAAVGNSQEHKKPSEEIAPLVRRPAVQFSCHRL